MASILQVEQIQGPTSGANANTITIPSGQTLDVNSLTATSFVNNTSPARLRVNTSWSNTFSSSTWISPSGWNTPVFDTHSGFDTLNGRYTGQVEGYYFISAGRLHGYNGLGQAHSHALKILKNGSSVTMNNFSWSQTGTGSAYPYYYGTAIVYLNGSTDYLHMEMNSSTNVNNAAASFEITLIREGAE